LLEAVLPKDSRAMDQNTNTSVDSDEPKPLGGPLHPPQGSEPPAPSEPSITQPEPSGAPDPSSPVFSPSVPPPAPAAPPRPGAFTPPSNVIMPTQGSPAGAALPLTPQSPQSPLPPTPTIGAAADPTAPMIVSGGFAPGAPTGPVVGAVAPTYATPGQGGALPSTSKFRGLKPILIALAAIVVIGGGSAAAYFGVIVPNQPANVLKTAMLNSLKENSVSYNGNVSFSFGGSTGSGTTYQLNMSGSKNSAEKASDATLAFDGYGVKVSIEARIANQNLYVKAGDLSTLAALVGSFEPSLSSAATTISGDISNQWVEVDSATLNEIGIGCYINAATGPLTQADINTLTADYTKNSFLTIQKTTSTTVDGQAADEFAVNINDDKGAGFISSMGTLSSIKSMEACDGGGQIASSLKQVKGDNKQTPLTLWVSKSDKEIIEASATETPQDVAQTHAKGTVDLNFSYKPVTITAPANAESYLQMYTKLAPTLDSLSTSGLNLNSLSSSL
jgi:hypothetical protein